MRVVAVDPGMTTGVSVWERSAETAENPHGEAFKSFAVEGQLEAIATIWWEIWEDDGMIADVLVVEKFTISTATAKKTRGGSNTAIEIIGALRWLSQGYQEKCQFVEQTPADAMGFATDEKLKRLGWYTPGKDHARDSARHMLLYLSRTACVQPARLLP